MYHATENPSPSLAVVVATALQKQIAEVIIPAIKGLDGLCSPIPVSLEAYYQFGIELDTLGQSIRLKSFFRKPWYDRSPLLKVISLPYFVWQIMRLSRQFRYFLFFVDTGILERTAIALLKILGCRSIVLQDAMKLRPRFGGPNSLLWFGRGKADLYLLMGEHYRTMVRQGDIEVVGSPIYRNRAAVSTPGHKILVVNQCFSRYGYTDEEMEFNFVRQVVEKASMFQVVELRLHPHNNPSLYMGLQSPRVEVTYQKPLDRSFQEAGIVLGVNSTVILEALLYGRPVLILSWHPTPFEKLQLKGTIPCKNLQEMCDFLRAWSESPSGFLESIGGCNTEIRSIFAYSGQDSIGRIAIALEKIISETEGYKASC